MTLALHDTRDRQSDSQIHRGTRTHTGCGWCGLYTRGASTQDSAHLLVLLVALWRAQLPVSHQRMMCGRVCQNRWRRHVLRQRFWLLLQLLVQLLLLLLFLLLLLELELELLLLLVLLLLVLLLLQLLLVVQLLLVLLLLELLLVLLLLELLLVLLLVLLQRRHAAHYRRHQ